MITYDSDPNRTDGFSKAIISTIVAISLGGVDLPPSDRYPAFYDVEFVQLSIIRCRAEWVSHQFDSYFHSNTGKSLQIYKPK
jgi:hypothetical protein